MSKPKEYSYMTKDKLMTYTFVALLVITIVSAALWTQVTAGEWNLGLTVGITALIAVGVAVGLDFLLYKLVSDSPLNTMSAAVFGLIVADSYSLGVPAMVQTSDAVPTALLSAPGCFVYVALISLIGLVLFKKVQGLVGRKIVNPAAAAKFVVLLPFISVAFLAKDHFADFTAGGLSVPKLAGPIGDVVLGGNGLASFTSYLQGCYGTPTATSYVDLSQLMILQKFHGWVGGASSLAVIIVGIALFVLARRYIKWRITVAYFLSIAVMSLLLATAYGDGDLITRLLFSVFVGSSIFLGFFMATDPASTPLGYTAQIIFGAGLGVLTILIQTYMNFFGGSLLALLIMNFTVPTLDKIGNLKPMTESKEPKLPKAKAFPAEKVKPYECIRCGACMRVCCHKLSPLLIKTAFDKQNFDALTKLHADYCTGCGHCTFVCPARIDLRKSVLTAKGALRGQ
jgi:Na+-translocating ferredoxin:NAD+ oxidoreductase RnfD subunit/NAD-dependent dihydropyrimidine dehydrogenase PreA subunit